MKKIFYLFSIMFVTCINIVAHNISSVTNDSIVDTIILHDVTVSSLYRNNINTGSYLSKNYLSEINVGQGPDYVLNNLPNIYAYNDNGTHMGYTYFRIRGMGQERMNVTIDGMPWNEAEDFGCYFSNMPNLMASMHSIKAEKGASVSNNGTAAYAGNITLESVDLKNDTNSYVTIGGGSFNSYRANVVYNIGIKNNWGFHIAATTQSTDGYKVNTQNNSQSTIAKIGYYFNNKHSIDFLTMNGFHRNGQGYMGVTENLLPSHPTPFKQALSGNMQQETDNFFMSTNRIQYNGKFNKAFLTSSIYWNHLSGDYRIGWYDPTTPTGKVLNNYNLNQNLYGFNTIVKWYALQNLAVTGGVNAYMFQRRHKGYDITNTDTIINIWHENGKNTYYNNIGYKPDVNVFARIEYSPINNLHFNGNIQYRYTGLFYRVSQSAYNDISLDTNQDYNWNFLNYAISVNYDINNNSKVYARFAVTNREPSRTDLFGAEYYQGEILASTDNERVYDLELGYEIRNKYINFNINGFYMNFKNELVATGELSPKNFLPLHTQHDAYRGGIEIAADIQPITNFHFIFNSAWSINKLKNINGIEREHTFSPKFTLFSELNYKINKIKFGINTNYRSKVYIDIFNTYTLKDLFTLNTYVSTILNKRLEVSCNLNNITNRLNICAGSTDGTVAYYTMDSPFNFNINLKFAF